jgi:hypothetical protein
MADERDYLERSQSNAQKLIGRRMSDDELANNFILYGLKKRAGILEAMDAEPKDETVFEETAMRAALDRAIRRERLGDIHEALRKTGR